MYDKQIEELARELERLENAASTPKTRGRSLFRRPWGKAYTILAALVIVGGLALGAYVITHNLGPTSPGTTAAFMPLCNPINPSPAITPPGSSGYVTYSCGANAAFKVTAGTYTTAVPTFTLSTNVTDLGIFSAGTVITSCAGNAAVTMLASGTALASNPAAGTEWEYCADFASAPTSGIAAFSVTWSLT